MIKVQHEHEEQWWNGRQALLKRQASRAESQRKLDEVLCVTLLYLPGGFIWVRKANSTTEKQSVAPSPLVRYLLKISQRN